MAPSQGSPLYSKELLKVLFLLFPHVILPTPYLLAALGLLSLKGDQQVRPAGGTSPHPVGGAPSQEGHIPGPGVPSAH